jgi:hypothetical protein
MCRLHQDYWQSILGKRYANLCSYALCYKDYRAFKTQQIQSETSDRHVNKILWQKGPSLQTGFNWQPYFGRCHLETETVSHILCDVALHELRFCHLGEHFMKPRDYNEILCFVKGKGLLVE